MKTSQVAVANGRYTVEVIEDGSGPPLLFLHGISGLHWTPFLEGLAMQYRVIAPRTPGFGDGSQAELDTVQDLVYAYLDLLDALGLESVPVFGHSLGGMVATELAATQPKRFPWIALAAPMGFFHLDRPTFDFFACTPNELTHAFFADPAGAAAQNSGEAGLMRMVKAGVQSETGQELVQTYLERAKTLATAAKYLWPIPNRGLGKRIHRVTSPTLLIWGKQDHVLPPSYATDFTQGIRGATLAEIEDAGHELLLEQPDAVFRVLTAFAAQH